jgi:rRNA maturation RNase YbeY
LDISFYKQNVSFELNESSTLKWVVKCIDLMGFKPGCLSFVFCDDIYVRKINKLYLKHDYFTDVISFDHSNGKLINGDIFVSIDTVKKNALDYHVTFKEELFRVIIHGVLHLCGFNDVTYKEKSIMRDKENNLLKLII